MTFVFMLAAIVVITVIALLAVGKLGELPDTTSDRAPLALPDDRVLTNTDVDSLRFNVGARGYRMDEVDVVLDRLLPSLPFPFPPLPRQLRPRSRPATRGLRRWRRHSRPRQSPQLMWIPAPLFGTKKPTFTMRKPTPRLGCKAIRGSGLRQ